MSTKKELEAAVKEADEAEDRAMTRVNIAKDALEAAHQEHQEAMCQLQAAKLALAQSKPLAKTLLAFLQRAAVEGGCCYWPRHTVWRGKGGGKTADGVAAEKLRELGFVEIKAIGFRESPVATITDAGRAKLAEATSKGVA